MSYEQATIYCPYNSSHVLSPTSFVKHLKKCKSTNKHLFTQCDFNPLHVLRNEEMEEHYRTCAERKERQREVRRYDWISQPRTANTTFELREETEEFENSSFLDISRIENFNEEILN